MTADAKFLSSSVFLLSDPITGTLASICYGFYTKNENTKIIYENISLDLKVCFFFLSLILKEIQTFSWALKISWALGSAPTMPNG